MVITESLSQDVWARHYASPAGFRWWPNEELVRSVASRRSPQKVAEAAFGLKEGLVGRAVEMGCGNGANLRFLAAHFAQVIGIDACHDAVMAAANMLDYHGLMQQNLVVDVNGLGILGRVRVQHWDITTKRLPDGIADLVVDVMTSQHVTWEGHASLYRLYRDLLVTGGHVFLYHLTNRTSGAVEIDQERLDLFPDGGMVCLPDAMDLERVVRQAGFTTVRRGVSREYADGRIAHYAVIDAEAV